MKYSVFGMPWSNFLTEPALKINNLSLQYLPAPQQYLQAPHSGLNGRPLTLGIWIFRYFVLYCNFVYHNI